MEFYCVYELDLTEVMKDYKKNDLYGDMRWENPFQRNQKKVYTHHYVQERVSSIERIR